MSELFYQRAGVRIFCGDCRDICADLAEPADVLVTDPPYGMAWASKGTKTSVAGDGARQGMRIVRGMLSAANLAADAHLYMFANWDSWPDFYDTLAVHANVKNALIWDKGGGGTGDLECGYAINYEVVLYAHRGRRALMGGRDGTLLRGYRPVPVASRQHPTEKPVDLIKYLLTKSAPPRSRVLDPFMGSGATVVAAAALGLHADGIEIDESYCEIAARRVDNLLDQGTLPLEAAP